MDPGRLYRQNTAQFLGNPVGGTAMPLATTVPRNAYETRAATQYEHHAHRAAEPGEKLSLSAQAIHSGECNNTSSEPILARKLIGFTLREMDVKYPPDQLLHLHCKSGLTCHCSTVILSRALCASITAEAIVASTSFGLMTSPPFFALPCN